MPIPQYDASMTIAQLLVVFNQMATSPLRRWSGSKAALMAKVDALAATARAQPSGRTVKEAAGELLLTVTHRGEGNRPVGLPYDEILARLRAEFPDAETTNACLRWYAVKLNQTPGVRMPVRPRRRPARQASDA